MSPYAAHVEDPDGTVVEARLAWGSVAAGVVLRRLGGVYVASDGRQVPAWAVAQHWGTGFVEVAPGAQLNMRLSA